MPRSPRKPQLILVNERANSNVQGARNLKRWQDVYELPDAGSGFAQLQFSKSAHE
jgi:K+-sensing histidine kinase KdpD